MSTTQADTKGVLRIVKKSKDYLTPLFEAFTNSLEAIEAKYGAQSAKDGHIVITLEVSKSGEQFAFEKMSIYDNGVGFNPENFERFNRLFDDSKSKRNNGSGRIQYLHSFGTTAVESVYEYNNQVLKKQFRYSDSLGDNFTGTLFNDEPAEGTSYTKVTFFAPKIKTDAQLFAQLTASSLRDKLMCHYLLKFTNIMLPKIEIKYTVNGEEIEAKRLTKTDIPAPITTTNLTLKFQYPHLDQNDKFSWVEKEKTSQLQVLSFKLSNNLLKQNRTILFCDKTAVEEVPNIFKATEHFGNSQYLTAIMGEYLDELGVEDQARTKINFPSRTDIENLAKSDLFVDEESGYIFLDSIKKEMENKKYEIYPEMARLEDEQKQKVQEIAETFCISPDVVKATDFDANDKTNEQVLSKLYATESRFLSKQDARLKNIFDETKALDPTKKNYPAEIKKKSQKLLSLIPKQNSIALGRYIAHRELTIKTMEFILNNELLVQQKIKAKKAVGKKIRNKNEALLHSLLLPKKEQNDSNQALWVFDEQFLYFNGWSDMPLNEIKIGDELVFSPEIENHPQYKKTYGEKRPDICLFPEEGKCVILEFKSPDVDVSQFLNQIPIYVRLLANFTQPKFKFDTFYAYLVGENIDDMYLNSFKKTVFHGVWTSDPQQIRGLEPNSNEVKGYLQQEVLTWSALAERAKARNRKFAEILGIRKAQKEQLNESNNG